MGWNSFCSCLKGREYIYIISCLIVSKCNSIYNFSYDKGIKLCDGCLLYYIDIFDIFLDFCLVVLVVIIMVVDLYVD